MSWLVQNRKLDGSTNLTVVRHVVFQPEPDGSTSDFKNKNCGAAIWLLSHAPYFQLLRKIDHFELSIIQKMLKVKLRKIQVGKTSSLRQYLDNIDEFWSVALQKIFANAHVEWQYNDTSDTRTPAKRPFWIARTWFEQFLLAIHWTTFMQNFAATWPVVSEEMSKMWKESIRPAVSKSM